MKKKIIWILMCMMVLCFCGEQSGDMEKRNAFAGRWQCAETPIEHPEYYSGYLMWVINQDGSFSMYDAEAGNPGIRGEIQILSDQKLRLICDAEEDFDPPVTWERMEKTQTVTYAFITDKELRITFTDQDGKSTLVFYKWE